MLSGVMEIDQGTLMQMLRFYIKNGGNLMTFGPAGIGKTEMAMQACEQEEYNFVYLNLSVLEAPDLMGLPVIDESAEVKRSEYALPKMLPPKGSLAKPIVLLVDEADKAKPELQNPMLELFQFRSVNGTKLDVHAVVATGNLPDENAFSQPMSHALMNRCGVYRVTHAFDPWQEWAVAASVNPLVIGFLSSNPEFLLQPPPEGDDTAYCHPSPRAWTLAARDVDAAPDTDVNFQTLLVSARVGQPAAVKFRVWLEHYRFVEPMIRALVEKGEAPSLHNSTLDRIFVCAISGVEAIVRECRKTPTDARAKEEQQKRVRKVTENVMNWVKDLPSEIQIGALKSTLTMKMIQENSLTTVKPFMDAYVKIRKVMKPDGK